MKQFTELYETLDGSTKTSAKVKALVNYFSTANEKDIAWTVALLCGKRPKRNISTALMRQVALELSAIPNWLFEECYASVGDLSETISMLMSHTENTQVNSYANISSLIEDYALLKNDEEKIDFLRHNYSSGNKDAVYIFNKLIGGSFRVGVSKALVYKALAKVYQVPESHVAHCMMGKWQPQETIIGKLLTSTENTDASRPYPFYLAYALDVNLQELGPENDWQAEYKFDGIRGQIIKRHDEVFIWTRGEELVTDKYPELAAYAQNLPNGTVLDGEIIGYKNNEILSFAELQKRIGRKTVGKKLLSEVPITMICYDILELDSIDIRNKTLAERRQKLEEVISATEGLLLSENVRFNSWEELQDIQKNSRIKLCEGLMLKHNNSTYESGRKRGMWWKWKVDPYTIDAVLLYAQVGHGRRANLFTDYTFAIWDGDLLLPFAKAYSGLTDKEIIEVDAWIKKNTKEKFGPVRSVNAELVFELAFEGIQASTRHKSGIAVRFPRIVRWRKDKKIEEANTKTDILNLLQS
jgi:DNA ligase 1